MALNSNYSCDALFFSFFGELWTTKNEVLKQHEYSGSCLSGGDNLYNITLVNWSVSVVIEFGYHVHLPLIQLQH